MHRKEKTHQWKHDDIRIIMDKFNSLKNDNPDNPLSWIVVESSYFEFGVDFALEIIERSKLWRG